MEIRLAQREDIPGMIALLRQVGQVHHVGRPDIFRSGAQKYNEAQLETMLDDPENPIFVAHDGEKVLGYGFCFLQKYESDPVLTDRRVLYLDDLCVDESCRGQQVGQKIFDHICSYAKEKNYHSVTLNVWSCNPGAMKFYEKMGMKPQKIGMELLLEEK